MATTSRSAAVARRSLAKHRPAQPSTVNACQRIQHQISGRLVASTERNLASSSLHIRSQAVGSPLAADGDVLRTARPSRSVTLLEGTERAVSDLKVEQKQTLSREEAARLIKSNWSWS